MIDDVVVYYICIKALCVLVWVTKGLPITPGLVRI